MHKVRLRAIFIITVLVIILNADAHYGEGQCCLNANTFKAERVQDSLGIVRGLLLPLTFEFGPGIAWGVAMSGDYYYSLGGLAMFIGVPGGALLSQNLKSKTGWTCLIVGTASLATIGIGANDNLAFLTVASFITFECCRVIDIAKALSNYSKWRKR